ncbi:tetratricopeptide repeat protein [Volucribacter amazonae]|uniref:Tetratricopeptide repeat protein n=1 Tax=Volucribacter amazonae TaxID=256731 RepID=A0A9X4PE66_9PAST|nr:tetratricopeptide repeat protein [Volucribacter amazonae]MDG6896019.1 hypothetical protein [Volucribacter amazonae]
MSRLEQIYKELDQLLQHGKYSEAIEMSKQSLKLADDIEDPQEKVQEQNTAKFYLGGCYFQQALNTEHQEEALKYFENAIQHFGKALEFAEQLSDEQQKLQEQNNALFMLGHCYFQQALKTEHQEKALNYFENAIQHFGKALEFAEQLRDEQQKLPEKNDTLFILGRCYFEQALKTEHQKEALKYFKNAIQHFKKALKYAEQLSDEQQKLQKQNNAQYWLGRCYFQQALKTKQQKEALKYFKNAIQHFKKALKYAEQLSDEQQKLQKQNNAQYWLGRCYFQQALKTKQQKEALKYFKNAIDHFEKALEFAEQLSDERQKLQEQNNAQYWLGRCYFQQALNTEHQEEALNYFENAIQHFGKAPEFAEQLSDEQQKLQEQNNAQYWLGRCYFQQALNTDHQEEALNYFENAIQHFGKALEFAEQLSDEQQKFQEQNTAKFYLGVCYFQQALKTKHQEEILKYIENAIQHFGKALEFASQISDEQQKLQEQNNAQYWLGRCYFQLALKTKQQKEALKYFEQAIYHFKESLKFAKQLSNEERNFKEQNIAQHWLGSCYFQQALKTELQEKALKYFKNAIQHFKKALKYAEQLSDEQQKLQEQNNNQFWLGQCYFQQALKTEHQEEILKYFKNAIQRFGKALKFAEQLSDEQQKYQEQNTAQYWLGRCYFEQALKIEYQEEALKYFEEELKDENLEKVLKNLEQILKTEYLEKALKPLEKTLKTKHQKEYLKYLEKLLKTKYQEKILEYLEQELKIKYQKESLNYFKKAIKNFEKALEFVEKLKDEQQKLQNKNNIQIWIARCYFEKSLKIKDNKSLNKFFDYKKQIISKNEKLNKIDNPILDILNILYLMPCELEHIKLSHYTTPNVCEKLFGINSNNLNRQNNQDNAISMMRMNSITYMNDPYEGKVLLNLLSQQELEIENIKNNSKYHTFITCFSKRVNDLNQFRLYGKEDNIEASGCCLVFDKKAFWRNKPNINNSFSISNKVKDLTSDINNFKQLTISINQDINYKRENIYLPIYQVAYIAYLDNYNNNNDFETKISDTKNREFGIYISDIYNNDKYEFLNGYRKNEFQKAINDLLKKENITDIDNLEYIRYLFKDYAFKDEDEFRLLKVQDNYDGVECCENTQQLYIEYADITSCVDEIIVGTNYENTEKGRKIEYLRYQIDQKMKEIYGENPINVIQSSLPINYYKKK